MPDDDINVIRIAKDMIERMSCEAEQTLLLMSSKRRFTCKEVVSHGKHGVSLSYRFVCADCDGTGHVEGLGGRKVPCGCGEAGDA